LLGGNFYQSKPEVGIYDASYGLLLKGDGQGKFKALPMQQSGVNISGAIRDISVLKVGKQSIVILLKNNDKPAFLRF
jgi:hypothetical protein